MPVLRHRTPAIELYCPSPAEMEMALIITHDPEGFVDQPARDEMLADFGLDDETGEED